MACGMCEAHINDAVRNRFAVKKVTSSHKKGKTEIIAEDPIDSGKLEESIRSAGYEVTGVRTEPYEKKGFSFLQKVGGKRGEVPFLFFVLPPVS